MSFLAFFIAMTTVNRKAQNIFRGASLKNVFEVPALLPQVDYGLFLKKKKKKKKKKESFFCAISNATQYRSYAKICFFYSLSY